MADRNGSLKLSLLDTAKSVWSSPLQSSEVAVALCALLLVSFLWTRWYTEAQQRKHKLPPGPRPWPVVGNALALGSKLPHRTLHALATKYGGLMYLRLGSRPCIVVSTAAMAKELYKTNDASFASRPKMLAWTVWNDNDPDLRNLGGCAYGPFWRQLKKFLTTEVFSSTRFASHRGTRAEEIQHMVKILMEEVSQKGDEAVVNLKTWCFGVSSNHITRIITGKRYYGTSGLEMEKERKELQDMSARLFELLGSAVISDFVPYLSFVTRLQGYPSYFAKSRDFVKNISAKILDLEGHRQRAQERGDDPNYVPDLTDVLSEAPFDDKDTKFILEEMLHAGTETGATTAEWAMSEIATKPDLIKRAQSELDAVVGTQRRLVEEADLPRLPFLHALLKESFRLHPPAPLLIPHESHEPAEVFGYHIPAGTMLLVNAFAVHRDPSVYENAEQFDPDRFLAHPEVNHLSGTDFYELIPFGAGRRMCPGYNMANTLVLLMLANLLYVFDWSLPEGQSAVDMTEFHGLTTSLKTPLCLVATPRIKLDL